MNNVGCRLWGKCWGDPANPVRLVVKWAGQQVFDGAVPTTVGEANAQQTDNHETLCTWTVDNVASGLVPVEVTVHDGSASVNNILLNNVISGRYVHFTNPDVVKERYKVPPKTDFNGRMYTDEEVLALYGFSQDAPPDWVTYVDVAAEETWVDGHFNRRMKNGSYTDGKLNAKLNGVDWYTPKLQPTVEETIAGLTERWVPPHIIQAHIDSGQHTVPGNRNYFLKNGDTLSFDYLIGWDV